MLNSSVVDPDPHQTEGYRIRFRIKVISWIRIWIRINLQMTSQNLRMEYESILALFQGFEPLFGTWEPDPDPHQTHKNNPHLQHC